MIRQFIRNVVEEKGGFSLDRPHRLGEKSFSVLVPVIRKTEEKRDYITFAEAKKVEVKDTGRVETVNVRNNEDAPLYISRGEIFKGDTQERAAIHGHIIQPNNNLNVAVRCVHLSKGVNVGADMAYGGRAPYSIDLSNQGKTWDTISTYSNTFGTGSVSTTNVSYTSNNTLAFDDSFIKSSGASTYEHNTSQVLMRNADFYTPTQNNNDDDLVGTLDNLTDSIKDAMRKVPFVENQVGGIFIIGSEIHGLDIYDLPTSWQSVKNDIIKKEGSAFIDDSDDLFVMRPEKAGKIISKKMSEDFSEKVIYSKEYSIIEIRYKNLVGEATLFKNKVIHLTLWRV